MSQLQLAQAILATAKAREESFTGTRYELTLQEAANKVGGVSEFATPAYLLLTGTWNDSIEWAESTARAISAVNDSPEVEALKIGVELVDRLLPQIGKIAIDVGLVNEFLMTARPLIKGM